MAQQDHSYIDAQRNLKRRLEQYAAASTTNPDAPPQLLDVKKVLFAGAPDEDGVVVHTRESFARKFGREYEHGKPKDRFDAVIMFADTDLRATSHSDVTQAVLQTIKSAFEENGIRTDTIDFSGNAVPQSGKIKPGILIDTSVTAEKLHNEVHLSMDLPEGVELGSVVDKLACQPILGSRTAALAASAGEGLARTM